VAKHLSENPTYYINFNEPEILCLAYNAKELRIKEALLIHQLQPDTNIDISSFSLDMFNS